MVFLVQQFVIISSVNYCYMYLTSTAVFLQKMFTGLVPKLLEVIRQLINVDEVSVVL